MKALLSIFIMSMTFVISQASANVWHYDKTPTTLHGHSGHIMDFETTFNDMGTATNADGVLDVSMTYSHSPYGEQYNPNVAWFVITNGGEPIIAENEAAQMFVDLNTGDLFVYEFKNYGMPDAADHIVTYNNFVDIQDNGSEITINIDNMDVSTIHGYKNTPEWKGVSFDNNVGVWMNMSTLGDAFQHDGELITAYQFTTFRTAFDVHHDTIDEPMGLAILGMLLIGLVARRKPQ